MSSLFGLFFFLSFFSILSPPSSKTAIEMERYRCINSSSTALQQRLLRHGPAYEYLLVVMGFVRTSNPPVRPGVLQNPNQEYFYLPQNVDLDDLNRNLQLLKAALASLHQGDSSLALLSPNSPLLSSTSPMSGDSQNLHPTAGSDATLTRSQREGSDPRLSGEGGRGAGPASSLEASARNSRITT